MASQRLIRMGIAQSFDLAPELGTYEGLTDESQPPQRPLFQTDSCELAAESWVGCASISVFSSVLSDN